MKTPGSIIRLFAGLVLAAGIGLVSPAQAGDVTVTEGETATFQITVTQNPDAGWQYPDTRIRVYYASDGGTRRPAKAITASAWMVGIMNG